MQLPLTVSTNGKHNARTTAVSCIFFALSVSVGCSSTPDAAPVTPSLTSETAKSANHTNETQKIESSEKAALQSGASHTEVTQTNEGLLTNAPSAQDQKQQQSSAIGTASNASSASVSLNPADNAEISRLKVEVLSLKDKVDSLQRKFELVLRSQRAGIFQVESPELVEAAVAKAKLNPQTVPPLHSDGPLDPFESEEVRAPQNGSSESPQLLVDRALVHLTQSDYAKVLQLLEDFQTRFPNNPLNSTASLALAEAYVELQSPQRALPHVRSFYLQHPNDIRMPNAKWFEARIQEQLKAPQRAAQLYREVIALAPKSDLALKARASLEKLAEGRMQ